jgi:preprotein translocase subunit SecD
MREVRVRANGPRVEVLAPASVPKGDVTRMLAMGGVLSFHVVVEDPNQPGVPEMLARMETGAAGPKPQTGDRLRWLPGTQAGISPVERSTNGVTYVLVHASPDRAMTHDDPQRRWSVKHAERTMDPKTGELKVAFELDARGAALFGDLTGNNIGRKLAIALDGNLLSAPTVNSRINGHGIITGHRDAGGFTDQEAHQLAATINAGSLPAKLSNEPVSEDYLTISLGLPPTTRFLLKCAAAALGAFAAVLLIARTLLRRFRPTPAEQMNRFLENETT